MGTYRKSSTGIPHIDTALEYQYRRRAHALGQIPPDRKEAALCVQRIDGILDRRPRTRSVASDGEIVWDDLSPWIKAQVAQNDTGLVEPVITPERLRAAGIMPPHGKLDAVDVPDDPAGGGVGVLDRP